VVVGFAVKFDTIASILKDSPISFGSQNPNHGGDMQVSLVLELNGKLSVYRGGIAGTLLATSTTVLQIETWYYLELRVYVDNTLGEYELKIDGVTEISATSVDTQGSATDDAIGMMTLITPDFLTSQTGKYTLFDDMYIRGDTVNTAGGFFGDVRIEHKLPNANGTNRDWTLSTGTDDFAVLDEVTGTMTDYAYTSTAADQITCGMEDVSGTSVIKEVTLIGRTKIGSSGARDLKPVCKSGATTDVGAAKRTLQDSYLQPVTYSVDPNTAATWTETNLNAAEFGFEIV
jgi:hypothetical protein